MLLATAGKSSTHAATISSFRGAPERRSGG
jgi:hypothetical protein